ncbi:MAG: glycosyltransferase family 4 protein [Clostridium sp.]|uniref:glycosyltransferase family 4 protein n=1 Tax=Clostridium sp. TaxID=1506 RepID=UPI003F3ACDB5
MNRGIIFVDPMSYNNLQIYDDNLLENINEKKKIFLNNLYEGKLEEKEEIEKIFNYSNKTFISKNISYIKSIRYMKRYIKKYKDEYSVIHFQWFKNPYVDYQFLQYIKKFTKLKIVYTAHNVLPHDTRDKYKKIYSKIYRIVDKVIVHTERTKKEIMQKFNLEKNKIEIIRHGMLEEEYVKRRNEIKKSNKIRLVFIGHIRENKGIDILAEAWNEELDKKYELIVAGNYAKKIKKVERLKNFENVKLDFRFLSDEEFQDYMELADILILPYKEISQSGVMMSSLSMNKPIVVTDVGGLTDFFEYGKVGWIIEKNTKENIQKILNQINKEEICEIKENCKLWEHIRKEYNWKEIGMKTQELYRNL